MKCICGYEGIFFTAYLRELSVWKNSDGDDQESDNGYLTVHICQKCGTLKVDMEETE